MNHFYIFLQNYEELYIVRTKEFNKKVEEHLKWLFKNHDIIAVIKNPEDASLDEWCYLNKERLLEVMEWRIDWWSEDEEEIQEKVEFIKSVLV